MPDIVIGSDKVAELTELMQDCAQAMYDDAELNAYGNGVNASEASSPLQVVAEILGIDGPRTLVQRMYDGED